MQQSHVVVVVCRVVVGIHDIRYSGQLNLGAGQAVGASTNGKGSVSLDTVRSGQNPVGGDQSSTASNGRSSKGTADPDMPRQRASCGR